MHGETSASLRPLRHATVMQHTHRHTTVMLLIYPKMRLVATAELDVKHPEIVQWGFESP